MYVLQAKLWFGQATPSAILAGFALSGCIPTFAHHTQAEAESRRALDCQAVELAQQSEHQFTAVGCGRQTRVACSAGGLEPRCFASNAQLIDSNRESPTAIEPTPTELHSTETSPVEDSSAGASEVPPHHACDDPESALRQRLHELETDILGCSAGQSVTLDLTPVPPPRYISIDTVPADEIVSRCISEFVAPRLRSVSCHALTTAFRVRVSND